MLKSPLARLFGRALLAGGVAFAASMQASNSYTREAIVGAGVAAALAFAEAFTPLNPIVGFFKRDETKVVVADLLKQLGNPTAAAAISRGDVIAAAKAVAK